MKTLSKQSSTDCREENGITVGLIDGMIAIARVLRTRRFDDAAVKEAMDDFKQDEDIKFLTHNERRK